MARIRWRDIPIGLVILLLSPLPLAHAQNPSGEAGQGRPGFGPGGPGGPGFGPGGPGFGPGGPGFGPGGPGFGPGGPGFGSLFLVNIPAVQDDLKLTEEQKTKIKDLNETLARKRREAFPNMRGPGADRGLGGGPGGPPNPGGGAGGGQRPPGAQRKGAAGEGRDPGNLGEGRPAPGGQGRGPVGPGGPGFGPGGPGVGRVDFQAMMTAMAAQRKETEDELAKILDERQRTRLEQIALRQEGPLAVARPEIAKRIDLSAAQSKQIQSIVTKMRSEQAQLRQGFRPPFGPPNEEGGPPNFDPQAMRAQFEQMRQASEAIEKKAVSQVAKVLKPSQKDAFNKLLGEPFDVSKLTPNVGGRLGGPPGAPSEPGGPGPGPVAPASGPRRRPGGN